MSLALDPCYEDLFTKFHTESDFTLSLLHYPGEPVTSTRLVRSPAHRDFGTITLLFQDGVGGLEIEDTSYTIGGTIAAEQKDRKFIPVTPESGRVLVFNGIISRTRSGGRWQSILHRVSEPPQYEEQPSKGSDEVENLEGNLKSAKMVPARYSVAFFSAPDRGTKVESHSSRRDGGKSQEGMMAIEADKYIGWKRREQLGSP